MYPPALILNSSGCITYQAYYLSTNQFMLQEINLITYIKLKAWKYAIKLIRSLNYI